MYGDGKVIVPSKAARARADQIVAAYDEWAKERIPPRGYKKLARESDRAFDATTRLENKILKTRATTIEGMIAKIRCAHAQAAHWRSRALPGLAKLEKLDLHEIAGNAEDIALSIFRDIQRLAVTEGTREIEQLYSELDPKLQPSAAVYLRNLSKKSKVSVPA